MRVALIGFGAWGREHARAITSLPGLELAAIACASAPSAAAASQAHPSARILADWREALAMPDVDVVDVVTPNHLHAAIAIAALRAGKDVLLEKPLAISAADCDAVLAAERDSGRLVSVCHELRQSQQWGRIKSLIDDDAIGAPRYLNVGLFRNAFRQGAAGWRYDDARVGSWLLEEAVHYVDLALWYFERHGAPASVRAFGSQRTSRATGMHDSVSIVMRYASGAYATINHCVAGFEHHLVLEVAGTDGAVRTHWSGAMDRDHHAEIDLRVQPRGFAAERGVRESQRVAIARSGEVHELTEHIRRSVEGFVVRRALVPAAQARNAVLLCLAAERSLAEDREIDVAPV